MLPIGSWNPKGSVRVFQISSQVMTWPLAISSAKKKSTALRTLKDMQTTALCSFAWIHSSLKHRCRATTHWHAAPRRWPGPTCGDAIGASKVTGDLQGLGIKNVSRIQSLAVAIAARYLTLKKTMQQGHQKNPRKQFRIVGFLSIVIHLLTSCSCNRNLSGMIIYPACSDWQKDIS